MNYYDKYYYVSYDTYLKHIQKYFYCKAMRSTKLSQQITVTEQWRSSVSSCKQRDVYATPAKTACRS